MLASQATPRRILGRVKGKQAMFDDDEVPRRKTHEVGMPIDTMSVGELEERIALLEEEIARLRAAIDARKQTKAAADSLFKR